MQQPVDDSEWDGDPGPLIMRLNFKPSNALHSSLFQFAVRKPWLHLLTLVCLLVLWLPIEPVYSFEPLPISNQWQELVQRSITLNETALAESIKAYTATGRADQQTAYFPLTPWQCPTLQDPKGSGEEVWQAALVLAATESKRCIRAALQAAQEQRGELAYRLLWQAHHFDPANQEVAKQLAADRMLKAPSAQRGTRPLTDYRWPARSYWEVASEHFRVLTQGDPEPAKTLCVELERGLAVWRQVLFPLWSTDQLIADSIRQNKPTLAPSTAPMRVVLFPDRAGYLNLLEPLVPGVGRSTGYYAPKWNVTFVYTDTQSDRTTQFHELTHQFLQEGSRFRGARTPGRDDGFWVVEGIACYAESIQWFDSYATLGGWDAPRMNTARYRWLQQQHRRELREMTPINQAQIVKIEDLAEWYTDAAVYVHHFLDRGTNEQRQSLFDHLEAVYRRSGDARWDQGQVNADMLVQSLQVTDQDLAHVSNGASLRELCLGGTEVTPQGLQALPPLPNLRWLDLAALPVDDQGVLQLLRQTKDCEKLNLERTKITDAVAVAIARQSKLRELDLSSTRTGNAVAQALQSCKELEVLWLTATQMEDGAIDGLLQLPKLRRVDVQRTRITPGGVQRLKREAGQRLDVNPLQIQTATP